MGVAAEETGKVAAVVGLADLERGLEAAEREQVVVVKEAVAAGMGLEAVEKGKAGR